MESSTSVAAKDFSSIARRLLLNKESTSVIETVAAGPNSSVSFYDVALDRGEATHAEYLLGCPESTSDSEQDKCKYQAKFPGSSVNQSPALRSLLRLYSTQAKHNCNGLCDRFRGLKANMLTAPVEKPYQAVQGSKAVVGRPSLGRKAKSVVKHVREFFEEMKRQIGETCHGTIMNSAVQMTALACGVSPCTVSRLGPSPDPTRERPQKQRFTGARKALQNRSSMRMVSLKQYGEEWGEVVRHFVHNELERETNVTVTDLHIRLCYAYADFPMPPPTLYAFLKALGFSYRVDGAKSYIVSDVKERKSENV